MESYDPYTDSWTPASPALKYVSNFAAAGCRGRLYLVGSSACKYNALALQCYNPVTGGRPAAGARRAVLGAGAPGEGQVVPAPSARLRSHLSEGGGRRRWDPGGGKRKGSPAQVTSPLRPNPD